MKILKTTKSIFPLLAIVFLLLLVPTTLLAQEDCQESFSGSSNGDCFEVSLEVNCADGFACAYSYGGCDWGDVSVFYFNSSCN